MAEELSEIDSTNKEDDEWAGALAEQNGSDRLPDSSYKKAELQDLSTESDSLNASEANMDVILGIPVTLSVEIGSTEIPIQNLLQLSQGSVVELDRLAGEPMDVLINGTLIAQGEVVVVNEKFGVRLTDVISPADRVKKLR